MYMTIEEIKANGGHRYDGVRCANESQARAMLEAARKSWGMEVGGAHTNARDGIAIYKTRDMIIKNIIIAGEVHQFQKVRG